MSKEVYFQLEEYVEDGEDPSFYVVLYWEEFENDEVPADLATVLDEYIDWGGEQRDGQWWGYCSYDFSVSVESPADLIVPIVDQQKILSPIFEKYGYKFTNIRHKVLQQ